MANALYDKAREGFLAGNIDWDADTIKVQLLDSADYVLDLALHDFLADVPAAARVATSGALTSKTVAGGVADAANVTLTAVTGDVSEYVNLFVDSGVEATSELLVNIDTATGLPVTPNGGDININWSDGADKIFKL